MTKALKMQRLLLTALIVLACLAGVMQYGCASTDGPAGGAVTTAVTLADAGDSLLARAFAEHTSDVEVEGRGTVTKLLADDNDGSRHQRFIVQLDSGQTLLISHNVDVAPRVSALQVGDAVSFKGEYIWNSQGGLVHWTHHDPAGEHAGGWIEHDGDRYEWGGAGRPALECQQD